jgi:hypothetical protein
MTCIAIQAVATKVVVGVLVIVAAVDFRAISSILKVIVAEFASLLLSRKVSESF